MIHIIALQNLVHDCVFTWEGTEWEGLNWQDERNCPTERQWENEKQKIIDNEIINNCKKEAQRLLTETDFADLYSNRLAIENIEEIDIYRNEIRKIRLNPVKEPIFPNKPKIKWREQ
jgi:hypothetical protein